MPLYIHKISLNKVKMVVGIFDFPKLFQAVKRHLKMYGLQLQLIIFHIKKGNKTIQFKNVGKEGSPKAR